MCRALMSWVTIVSIMTIAGSAQAGDWDHFWSRYQLDVKRNEAWPQPFLNHDQAMMRSIFAPQIAAGWRAEHTLGPHHFDPESHQLNKAGLIKVQAILVHSPEPFRTIYVHHATDADGMKSQLVAVDKYVHSVMPKEFAPAVVRAHSGPHGMAGQFAELIYRRFQETMPEPSVSGTPAAATISGK